MKSACSIFLGLVAFSLPAFGFVAQDPSALLNGSPAAISYSGFRTGQHPDRGDGAKNPTRQQILEDLRILSEQAGFGLIRLYDSGQNSEDVLAVIAEEKIPLKVMLGAWLDAELSNHQSCAWLTEPIPEETLASNRLSNEVEVKQAIALAKRYPEIIAAVNIGNEALVDWNDHMVPLDRLVGFLKQAREALDQPVTTAENYAAYARYGKVLSQAVDFAGIHTYPVWEGKTIEQAMDYTVQNMMAVQQAMPGVPLAIAEAGWATTASEFPTQANQENQVRYYKALMDWAKQNNLTVFWFEAFDEDWKGDSGNLQGAEKHWGLFFIDRKPKQAAPQVGSEKS